MRRLNAREVELTDEEMRATDFFDQKLDEGLGIPQAVAATRERYELLADNAEMLSEEFWAYLAE